MLSKETLLALDGPFDESLTGQGKGQTVGGCSTIGIARPDIEFAPTVQERLEVPKTCRPRKSGKARVRQPIVFGEASYADLVAEVKRLRRRPGRLAWLRALCGSCSFFGRGLNDG